jgi:uncharacterized protein
MPSRARSITTILFTSILILAGHGTIGYPTLDNYVTDNAGVLTSGEIYDIGLLCLEVYQEKGAEFAVLIVNTTQPDGIDLFAVKTFEENGLGQEGKDNGLLILLSTDEEEWRVEVGYGLEGVLPDSKVGSIGDDHMEPFLAQGDFYNGLLYTTAFLGLEVLDHYEEGEPPEDEGSPYPIPWLPLTTWQLVVVILVFFGVLVITKGRSGLWIGGLLHGKGGRKWGGGRSGGGGARGRW